MSDQRPKRETMSIEEATSTPSLTSYAERTRMHESLRPLSRSRNLLTEAENRIIDDILELLNKSGLTSYQSIDLLERLGRIIEMGQ